MRNYIKENYQKITIAIVMILATLLLCISTKMINPTKKASALNYNYDSNTAFGNISPGIHSVNLIIRRLDKTTDSVRFTIGEDDISKNIRFPESIIENTNKPDEIRYVETVANKSIALSNNTILKNLDSKLLLKNHCSYFFSYYFNVSFSDGYRLSNTFQRVENSNGVFETKEYSYMSPKKFSGKEIMIQSSNYNLTNSKIDTYAYFGDYSDGIYIDYKTTESINNFIFNITIEEKPIIPVEEKNESDLKNSVYGLSELFPDFDTNSWIDWYCAYLCENGMKTPQELTSPYSYQVKVDRKWSWKDWRFHPVYETRIEPKGERALLKKQEAMYSVLFQMVYATLEKDVQRYIENKKASYTAFADKFDELVPQKLGEKKDITLDIEVSVKGANYPVERVIRIPLKIYRPLGNNEDTRYYRLYLSHNDLDYLINDLTLRVVDLTHDSFGSENKEFEEDTYITNYYKKVNAVNGEVILDELISWCVPISVDTYKIQYGALSEEDILKGKTPHFRIKAICEANKEHKPSWFPDYKIESSQIQNYTKNSAIRVFVAEETVVNNMSTAEINATIVEGTTPPRYEMMMYMPTTIVNDTIIAGIERVYNQNYGGSCKFVGVSEKRNSTELITTPTMITNAAPTKTLYIVTEKNQSKIIVQTNKSSAVMYANYNEKLDTSKLPTTLAFQGKEYEIIGWTEEKVLYPWDLGYGPGREYNKIDFETWTATKSQHYLSPVLKADLPVVIPDPEPEPEVGPGEDNILSPMVDGWNNFVTGWNEFFDNMFGIKDKTGEGFKIFMIIIGSILGGGLLFGLLVRLIKWIKN